jgi:hypothetical protein
MGVPSDEGSPFMPGSRFGPRGIREHSKVNPMLDIGTGITFYLAAHTIVEFLGWLCAQPWWIAGRGAREAARVGART